MLKYILIIFSLSVLLVSCNNGKTKKSSEDILNDSTITIEQLNELIREDPKNADLFVKRSELNLKQQNLTEAANDLEIALKVDTLRQELYTQLSELYLIQGKSEEAKNTLFLCVYRFPSNVDARVKLAKIYFYVEMYSEAMTEIMYLESNKLQNADSYFTKALILDETGYPADAIVALKKTIEYDSKHWEAYNLIGKIYASQDDPLAVEYFKTAISLFPENSEIRFNAGWVFQQYGDVDAAVVQYNKAIEIDSLFYQAHYNLGYLYVNQFKDYNKAVEYFSNAINCDTSAYKAYYNRGFTYELLGKYKLAEADYRKALKILPNYDPAVTGLNEVIEKLR